MKRQSRKELELTIEHLQAQLDQATKVQRLRAKLEWMNQNVPTFEPDKDDKPIDLNAWARDMKAKYPDNPFSWTD